MTLPPGHRRFSCSVIIAACLAVIFPCTAVAKKDEKPTVQMKFDVTPRENLKIECSQLVAEQTDLDKALETCTAAIGEAPEDGDLYYYRSYAHYYRDELGAAEADATRAIELNSSRLARAYYLRGTIKERQRELRAASVDFKMALELSPDWAAARRKVDSYAWAYESE